MIQFTARALTWWLCWMDMRYRLAQSAVSWCIEWTSWLMFMDWCIDVLVGGLSQHFGWRLLIDALTCWLCVESTRWLRFTDAMTCWLLCWIDMLVDFHWCIDVLVGVLDQHANVCIVLLTAIVAEQLLHLVIKRNKKNYIFNAILENLHSAVADGWNVKQSII